MPRWLITNDTSDRSLIGSRLQAWLPLHLHLSGRSTVCSAHYHLDPKTKRLGKTCAKTGRALVGNSPTGEFIIFVHSKRSKRERERGLKFHGHLAAIIRDREGPRVAHCNVSFRISSSVDQVGSVNFSLLFFVGREVMKFINAAAGMSVFWINIQMVSNGWGSWHHFFTLLCKELPKTLC